VTFFGRHGSGVIFIVIGPEDGDTGSYLDLGEVLFVCRLLLGSFGGGSWPLGGGWLFGDSRLFG